MSILGNILSRITGGHPSRSSEAQTSKPPMGVVIPKPAAAKPAASAPPTPAAAPAAPAPVLDAMDVEKHLDSLAAKNPQKLDWRKSIVDMMKLLGMESSLSERKELAKELGYTGDTGDSAKMNMWLHQQVLQKIAQNGGKVPQDLLH